MRVSKAMAAASTWRAISMRVGGRLLVDVVEVEMLRGDIVLAEGAGSGRPAKGSSLVMRARVTAPETSRSMLSGEKSEEEGAGGAVGDEDAQADGARAGLLERFDLAEADAGGELVALIDDGLGVRGAGLEGAGEDIGGEPFEVSGNQLFSRHRRSWRIQRYPPPENRQNIQNN
jgi:hypothetical protein